MDAKPNDGWWKSLFQRSNRARHKARDEQLGSDEPGANPRPANFEVDDKDYLMSIYQDDNGDFHVTYYVCACGLKVVAINDDNDYVCDHCDKPCHWARCHLCDKMLAEE